MGFSSILRSAGKGVASVGRAVQNASRKLDESVAGPQAQAASPVPIVAPNPDAQVQAQSPTAPSEGAPAPVPAAGGAAPAAAPTAPAPKGFSLPDIGPAPDQNAPEFQGDGGADKYARAAEEYQHKQDIHKAFTDLDAIYSQAHPGRDFQKEYQQSLAELKQHEDERPQGSPLARAALALGDFNPAVRQSGRSNLAEYEKGVNEKQARSDEGFQSRLALRMKMHEQTAKDAEAEGNWKKALAEQEKLALLKSDEAALSHERDLRKQEVTQEGQTKRANIRADAMKRTAEIRTNAIGETHGLSGSFLQQFQKESAKAVARLLGPRDLTKEYTPADLDSITAMVEHLAEMFHDQQYGDGSSETYLRTHPTKRRQPKAATKEQF
jgi:hypothetical protein